MTAEFSLVYDDPFRRRCIGTLFWSNERVYHILHAATTANFFGPQARDCQAWLFLGKQALDDNLTLEEAIPGSRTLPSRPYPVPPTVFLIPTGHVPCFENGKFLGSGPPGAEPWCPAVTEVVPRQHHGVQRRPK